MNQEWFKMPMLVLISRFSGLAVLGVLLGLITDRAKGPLHGYSHAEVRNKPFLVKLPEGPSEGKPPFSG